MKIISMRVALDGVTLVGLFILIGIVKVFHVQRSYWKIKVKSSVRKGNSFSIVAVAWVFFTWLHRFLEFPLGILRKYLGNFDEHLNT